MEKVFERSPNGRPEEPPKDFEIPKVYSILIGGLAGSGKSTFLGNLYKLACNKDRSFEPFFAGGGKNPSNHRTAAPFAIRIADNFLAIDTKGVVPSRKLENIDDARKCWKENHYDEFAKLLDDPKFLVESLSSQQFGEIVYPQLFVLLAPATLFEVMFKCKKEPGGEGQLKSELSNIYLIKLWIAEMQAILPNGIRLVLTKGDLLEEGKEEVLCNAAEKLSLSKSAISIITNYSPGNNAKPIDEIEKSFEKLISELFDSVDAIIRPVPKRSLFIKKAIYHMRRNRDYNEDVTEALRDYLGTKEYLHINPQGYNKALKRDPFPLWNKELVVTYVHFGREKTVTVKESESLDLP